MTLFTQAGRSMSLSIPALGPDALLLEKLTGTETISELFHFHLDLLFETARLLPPAFDKVLGQKALVTFTLPAGGLRYIHGIINRFTRGTPVIGPGGVITFVRYRAELVPQFWFLTKRIDCRLFPQKSVRNILTDVLTGLDLEWQLERTYRMRDHCIQYRESDFAFVSRLMEEEGIWYYFKHLADKHVLVLGDSPKGYAPVPGPGEVEFDPLPRAYATAPDHVFTWEKSQEIASGQFTLWDYAFARADTSLAATRPVPDTVQIGPTEHKLNVAGNVDRLQVYDYPAGYQARFDPLSPQGIERPSYTDDLNEEKKQSALVRVEEEVAASIAIDGTGDCRHLTAGHKFSLTSTIDWFDGKGDYVVKRVEHHASQEGAYTSGSHEKRLDYRNTFSCLPAALTYRAPRRTPRPVIAGVQTGVVEGPDKQDVYTDKYGRVWVQFRWDRNGASARSDRNGDPLVTFNYWKGQAAPAVVPPSTSCWMRVATSWAGRKWGWLATPRIGEEVLIAFQDGDPDHPVVVGSVYNSVNQQPFPQPDNALWTGFKTHTPGGTEQNFNGLFFNDTKDNELVQLQAEKAAILTSKKDFIINVGGDHRLNVNGTYTVTYGTMVGLQPQAAKPSQKAWEWTAGGISASIGKSLSMVYGEASKATMGLDATVVVGNKIDLVVNPLTWLQGSYPNLGMLLGPVMGLVAGRNEFILGPKNAYIANTQTSVLLGGKNDVAINVAQYPALRILTGALALLTTAGMLAAGGAGSWVADNWSKGDSKSNAAMAMTGLGAGIFGMTAVTCMGLLVRLAYNSEAMLKAANHIQDGITARNVPVSTYKARLLSWLVNDAPRPNPPPPAGNLPRLEVHDGPCLADFTTCSIKGAQGITLGAGTVDGCKSNISFDVTPVLANLKLTQDNLLQKPTIQLDKDGITLSAGALPLAGSTIKIAADGITLTFMAGGIMKSKITIDAKGVKLECGPSSSLDVIPLAVRTNSQIIMAKATGGYLINTKVLFEEASGLITRAGIQANT